MADGAAVEIVEGYRTGVRDNPGIAGKMTDVELRIRRRLPQRPAAFDRDGIRGLALAEVEVLPADVPFAAGLHGRHGVVRAVGVIADANGSGVGERAAGDVEVCDGPAAGPLAQDEVARLGGGAGIDAKRLLGLGKAASPDVDGVGGRGKAVHRASDAAAVLGDPSGRFAPIEESRRIA